MSIDALAWAKKQTAGNPAAKLVLLSLADYADELGRAWPSIGTLATETEQSEDTVRRHIRALSRTKREGGPLIHVHERRRPNGSRTSNLYWLPLPGREEAARAGTAHPPGNLPGAPPQSARAPLAPVQGPEQSDENASASNYYATREHEALAEYLGPHGPSVVAAMDAVDKQPHTWAAAVLTEYGPQGLASYRWWRETPAADRPHRLAQALNDYAGAGHRMNAKHLASYVKDAVENPRESEHEHGPRDPAGAAGRGRGHKPGSPPTARRRAPSGIGAAYRRKAT